MLAASRMERGVALDCTARGYYYLSDTPVELMAGDWSACQTLCMGHATCHHFSFWPDGGCELQVGGDAALVNASRACDKWGQKPQHANKTCTGEDVVSGPKGCGAEYYGLYPFADQMNLTTPFSEAALEVQSAGGRAKGAANARVAEVASAGIPFVEWAIIVVVLLGVLVAGVFIALHLCREKAGHKKPTKKKRGLKKLEEGVHEPADEERPLTARSRAILLAKSPFGADAEHSEAEELFRGGAATWAPHQPFVTLPGAYPQVQYTPLSLDPYAYSQGVPPPR